ncbi:hypothetical protein ASswx1_34 [Aeromonas phage Asswx_1]|uniref:Uncharacterized protein n=1 Tax=Aeromonas phage Asswx_1 TaxID=2419739 RepID=A0A411B7X1_9CAUD|nr:hypothetical protein ASswx1_34 [Aeromonas phage Asswx_1]
MFKKTTKTDKSVAISKRISLIKTHVTNTMELFDFLSGVINKNILVGGKSIQSILGPLYYPSANKAERNQYVFSRFVNCTLIREKYGVRITTKNKYIAKDVADLLGRVFKVSTINVGDLITFVVKVGKPSGNASFTKNEPAIQEAKDKLFEISCKLRELDEEQKNLDIRLREVSDLSRRNRTTYHSFQQEAYKIRTEAKNKYDVTI